MRCRLPTGSDGRITWTTEAAEWQHQDYKDLTGQRIRGGTFPEAEWNKLLGCTKLGKVCEEE